MAKVNYELMLPHELHKAVEAFPVAYVPLGSLEWHGKHLGLGNDALKALGILEHTARRFGGVVLPPTYWGCVGKWHPWTFGDMGQELLTEICRYLCRSLAEVGFKVIIGVTGHDVKQQVDAMNTALAEVKAKFGIEGFAMMEGDLSDFGEHRMDHAAHWETSILMYLYPGSVDMHQIRGDDLTAPEQFNAWNSAGIGGRDPRQGNANKQLGERLVEGMAQAIGQRAQQLMESLRQGGKLASGPPPGGAP